MKLYFRLAEDNKDKIKMAKNTIFKPHRLQTITACPLPPFLKDAKCNCGKPAELVLDDMKSFICVGCIEKKLKNCTMPVKEDDVSIPITRTTILRLKFEWSANQERWYSIYGRNIRPQNWDKFLLRVRDIIVSGKMTLFNGDYKKDYKELVIF